MYLEYRFQVFLAAPDFDFKVLIVLGPNSVTCLSLAATSLQMSFKHTIWGGGDIIDFSAPPPPHRLSFLVLLTGPNRTCLLNPEQAGLSARVLSWGVGASFACILRLGCPK